MILMMMLVGWLGDGGYYYLRCTKENRAIKLFIIFYGYDFSLGIIHLKCVLVELHDKKLRS